MMEFKYGRRPNTEDGTSDKIKARIIKARVTVGNIFMAKHSISITSEIHSSFQDLATTLFRRGVMSEDGKICYGPGSIIQVERVE